MARVPLLLSSVVLEARDDSGAQDSEADRMTEKAPRGVEKWREKHAANKLICGVKCPKHRGERPGWCARPAAHVGIHSHDLEAGMKDYDPTRPTKGCGWGMRPPIAKRTHRPREVGRGPLDGFAGGP